MAGTSVRNDFATGRAEGGTRGPVRRTPLPSRQTLAAVAALTLSLGAFTVLLLVGHFPMPDVQVYRAEGAAALRGSGLYDFTVTEWELPATYPPFAALLFVPLALLPAAAAKAAFLFVNVALLALLVHLSLRLAGRRASPPALAAVTAAALWLEPVFRTLVFGQVNLALACLVLWDLGRPDGARGKGLAVGVATGIKLTPAVFAVHLLVTGRVRAAFTAFAGFLGTVLTGAFFLPEDSVEFWSSRLFQTGRVGKAWIVDNQSLQGLVARVFHHADPELLWLLPATFTGAFGLWLARRAHRRHGLEAWSLLCTAFTALLVSPISWTHHWVWCLPLLAVLAPRGGPAFSPQAGMRALRTYACAGTVLVFAARTMWLLPKHGDLDLRFAWWQQPLAAPYPLLALALLVALAWRLRHGPLSGAELRPQSAGSSAATWRKVRPVRADRARRGSGASRLPARASSRFTSSQDSRSDPSPPRNRVSE